MKALALTLCMMILLLGTYYWAEAEDGASVKDIRAALQNKQFEEAFALIDSVLTTAEEGRDFLIYLKGLSLFHNKNFSDAIGYCDEIIREHGDSPWYRKAIFLKAQCHIQLKQFEEAENIYDT